MRLILARRVASAAAAPVEQRGFLRSERVFSIAPSPKVIAEASERRGGFLVFLMHR